MGQLKIIFVNLLRVRIKVRIRVRVRVMGKIRVFDMAEVGLW